MAKAFADAYRSIAWTAVYVSPMKRTIATAKPLCDVLGLEMQLRDGGLRFAAACGRNPPA